MWVFIREECKNVIVIRKVSLLLTIKQESQKSALLEWWFMHTFETSP